MATAFSHGSFPKLRLSWIANSHWPTISHTEPTQIIKTWTRSHSGRRCGIMCTASSAFATTTMSIAASTSLS
ncbi:unnamed protein product [Symbiodinium sp. KB8]|nr:unnamed protein product [Symbiodinium sp. KB8]